MRLTIFRTLVYWVDGSYSTYVMQGINENDVRGQLLKQFVNFRRILSDYRFERVGEGQKLA
jgi:hypothetical protein